MGIAVQYISIKFGLVYILLRLYLGLIAIVFFRQYVIYNSIKIINFLSKYKFVSPKFIGTYCIPSSSCAKKQWLLVTKTFFS